MQGEDGLFYPEHEPVERHEDDDEATKRPVSTRQVIDTLFILGFQDISILEKTTETVQEQLLSELAKSTNPAYFTENELYRIAHATYILARIDASSIPEEAQTFIGKALEIAPALPDVPFGRGMGAFIALLDAAEAIDSPQLKWETVQDNLRGHMKEAFSHQSAEGGLSISGYPSISITTAYRSVYIATKLDVPYPNLDLLLKEIQMHEVKGGCLPIAGYTSFTVSYSPRAREAADTYYALQIASRIGFNDYNQDKIENFFLEVVEDYSVSPKDLYYALLGLRLLQGEVETELIEKINEKAIESAHELDEDPHGMEQFGSQAAYFCRLAEMTGKDVPQELLDKLAVYAQDLKDYSLLEETEGEILLDMRRLYSIWIIQSFLGGEEILTKEELIDLVMGLWSERGGFKLARPDDEDIYPALNSSYLGMELLSQVGAEELVDMDKLTDFVLSCQCPFGFTYNDAWIAFSSYPEWIASRSEHPEHGIKYYHPVFLSLTYQGIALIEQYGFIDE